MKHRTQEQQEHKSLRVYSNREARRAVHKKKRANWTPRKRFKHNKRRGY